MGRPKGSSNKPDKGNPPKASPILTTPPSKPIPAANLVYDGHDVVNFQKQLKYACGWIVSLREQQGYDRITSEEVQELCRRRAT